MSHFSAMKAKYSNFQQIVDTCRAMGVPASEIYALRSLGLKGCQQMHQPHVARSSEWSTEAEGCDIYVTQTGMRAMAQSAGAKGGEMGIYPSDCRQRCELGFQDCGCADNPGYVMQTDRYESGSAFPGYFTAMYQLTGIKNDPGKEASSVEVTGRGQFRIVVRETKKQRSRVSRLAAGARRLVPSRH